MSIETHSIRFAFYGAFAGPARAMFFQSDRTESFIKVRFCRGRQPLTLNRREWRKQRARRDHPKHASLIRRIENQYRLSVSEPISRTAACRAANEMRDVHQNEIYSTSDKEFGAFRASYTARQPYYVILRRRLLFYRRKINHRREILHEECER